MSLESAETFCKESKIYYFKKLLQFSERFQDLTVSLLITQLIKRFRELHVKNRYFHIK